MVKQTVKSRRLLYLATAVLIILVLLSLYVPSTAYPPYTSYSPKPDGAKAIFLLLSKEGVGGARLSSLVPPGRGLMIMLKPDGGLSAQEWQQVLTWVEQGNTLFLASDNPRDFYRQYGYELIPASGRSGTRTVSPDSSLLRDVRELTGFGRTRLRKHESMAFTYEDEQGIYLAETHRGQGRVILLPQPELFTNTEINRYDNLILLLNIVRLYGREGIWFNEFVHGYTWEKADREVFTWPLRLVVVQFALGVLLLFYYWGKRFGRPLPLPEHTGPPSGDYVSSLAHIYRQGRARHLILDSIYQGFKQDLAHYLGVPRNVSTAELAEIFSKRLRINTEKLQELLGRCERLLEASSFSETELVSLARELEIWREDNLNSRRKRRSKHDR